MGICMPGVITCPGVGDGDALGICIPGVITCGVGEGLGAAGRRLVSRMARVVVFFLGAARFGFGFAAEGFGITCPSCCGKALLPSANTSAREQSVRSHFLSPDELIIFPQWIFQIPTRKVVQTGIDEDTQTTPARYDRSSCDGTKCGRRR